MRRLIDFDLGTSGIEYRDANGRVRSFVNAIYWNLSRERIEAPFGKLVVNLDPDFHPEEQSESARSAFVLLNIGEVRLGVNIEAWAKDDAATVRRRCMEVTIRALELCRDEIGWDDERFRAIVQRVGEHRGPYRFERPDLTVKDRRTKRSYVSLFEFDEESSRLILECRDDTGQVLGSHLVIASTEPVDFYYFFNPRKAKRVEHHVEYSFRHPPNMRWIGELQAEIVEREGSTVAIAPLPSCP